MKLNKFIIVSMVVLAILFVGVASATEDLNATTGDVVADDSTHRLSTPIDDEITTDGGELNNASNVVAVGSSVNEYSKEKLGMSDEKDTLGDDYDYVLTPQSYQELGFDFNLHSGTYKLEGVFTGDEFFPFMCFDQGCIVEASEAEFVNMGIILTGDVQITGLTLTSTQYLEDQDLGLSPGAMVYVTDDNNILNGLTVNYAPGTSSESYGIYVNEANNFQLLNSYVNFTGSSYDDYEYAMKIDKSQNLNVQGNTIIVNLPILNVAYDKTGGIPGLDTDLVLNTGIRESSGDIIDNIFIANVIDSDGNAPTLDCVMMESCDGINFINNTLSETDFITPEGNPNFLNVLDCYYTNNLLIKGNKISVETTGGSENLGTSYPIQLTGPYENVVIDGNDLYAYCGGPALGVFSQNYYGGTEITVQNNYIDVTGLPTTNNWGLVSGIELQDDVGRVYGNVIKTKSITGYYESGTNLYGISYAQYLNNEHCYDIQGNIIETEGQYTIYLLRAQDTTIADNYLVSSIGTGDETVEITDAEGSTDISNNQGRGIFYVSPDGGDGNEGSEDAPLQTINAAVNAAPEGGVVYLLEGTHVLPDNLFLDHSVSIVGANRKNTVIDCDEQWSIVVMDCSFDKLSIENVEFVNAPSLNIMYIQGRISNINIENCLFNIDNNVVPIAVMGEGNLNFVKNIFVDPLESTDAGLIAIEGDINAEIHNNIFNSIGPIQNNGNGLVNVSYNYFGTNNPDNIQTMGYDLENIVVAQNSASSTEINAGGEATITVDFNNVLDLSTGKISRKNRVIPDDITVSFSATSGTLGETGVDIENGKATTTYTNSVAGSDTVTITVPYQQLTEQITVLGSEVTITVNVDEVNLGQPTTVYVTVPGKSGTVTIKVNNQTVGTPTLSGGSATQSVDASYLVSGENTVEVTYDGTAVSQTFNVLPAYNLDGIVTAETFFNYFNASNSNRLCDYVPEGATLDFRGSFISDDNVCYIMEINKPINMISTTKDAYINLNTISTDFSGQNPGDRFTVSYNGSGTNISDISFYNSQLWFFGAHNLTLYNVTSIVDGREIGSGVGVVAFRGGSSHIKVKNCYFSTKDNGGHSNFVLTNASYISVDNCTIIGQGNVGNLIYLNLYNIETLPEGVYMAQIIQMMNKGQITINDHNNFTNCKIYGPETPLAICYLFNNQGNGFNIFENNTVVYGGAGIYSFGNDGIIRGNNFTGGCGINSAGSRTLIVNNNITDGTVSASGDNEITGNRIITTQNYAIDLGKTKNNNIHDNYLVSNNGIGDAAVNLGTGSNNAVSDNLPLHYDITISVENPTVWLGSDNSVTVTIPDATGQVTIKLNDAVIATPTLSGGSVTQTISADDISAGTNTIEVFYEYDTNTATFNALTAPDILIEVTKEIDLGDDNSVTVTIADGSGEVTIKLNGNVIATPTLVSGSATQAISASDIVAGTNTVEVTYNGLTNSTTFTAKNNAVTQENVVTPENFFDFFDNDGYLKNTVAFDELIFKGEFNNNIVDLITIGKSISIIGDGATLNNVGFEISSTGVTLDNLELIADENLNTDAGSLILVGVSDVTISNLNITYETGDERGVAIEVGETVSDVIIINNNIFFESHVTSDEEFSVALLMVDTSDCRVDGNSITARLPCVYCSHYDDDYHDLMGSDKVDPVRLKDCDGLVFTNNYINSTTNDYSADYPTIQAMQIIGCSNSLIDHNNISMIDEMTPHGMDNYLYGINFGFNQNVTFSNNNFNMSTSGGEDEHGTAYAFQGVESEVIIIGNNITSVSNGPNLGIYIASFYGGDSTLLIENNFINVTGYASLTSSYSLVSGIEIQNGNAKIYNNTIYTYNVNEYREGAYMYGISYAQWLYGDRSFDIQDNEIHADGQYTISVIDASSLNVERNVLYAHELTGDDSINPGTCQDVNFANNLPSDEQVIIAVSVLNDTIWLGESNSVTVNVAGGTGSVTIKVNGKTIATPTLQGGSATQAIDAGDIVGGTNTVVVEYAGASESKTFYAYGLVTNETWDIYFDKDNSGRLTDFVPVGATLDFQGKFLSSPERMFVMEIDKPVNIISSSKDAFIDLNTTAGSLMGENPGDRFTVSYDGSGSNISDLYFHNTQLWLYNTHHVTLDNISAVVEGQKVGSGVGATAIRANSTYITVKNSYFYTRDNGGSTSIALSWADHCTIENNTILVEGNVGNMIYLNTYNVDIPQGVSYNVGNVIKNNVIWGNTTAAAIRWGIVINGAENIIDNNTIHYNNGVGLAAALNGENIANNVFSNNKLYGTCSIGGMTPIANAIFHDNYVSGNVNVGANCELYDNTVDGTFTVNAGGEAYGNTIGGTLTANSAYVHDNTASSVILNGENARVTGTVSDLDIKSNVVTSDLTVTGTLRFIGSNSVVSNATVNNVVFGPDNKNKASNSKLVNSTIDGTVTFTARYSSNNELSGNNISKTVILQGASDVVYQNNITTTEAYAVDATSNRASDCEISDNYLISNGKKGNAAVTYATGKGHIVKENGPDFAIAELSNIWACNDQTVVVNVYPSFTSTAVCIKVNDKLINETFARGEISQVLKYSDLKAGLNTVEVTAYGITKTATFNLQGVITKDTVFDYFDQSNNGALFDFVPVGATLDFQGEIKATEIGNLNITISKPVNVISSTHDSYIDLNTTAGSLMGEYQGDCFTVNYGGSGSNITGIYIHNTQVWITNTHNVVFDNVSVVVVGQRVGSGVGTVSVRDNSSYVTIKNGYFYTQDNGGSSTLVMAWANHCTFDNNTVTGRGDIGNMIYSTTYNVYTAPAGYAVSNDYNVIKNNHISNPDGGTGICRSITIYGSHNIIDNNTINKGSGFFTQWGTDGDKVNNTYSNNRAYDIQFFDVFPNSTIYNNYIVLSKTFSTGANSTVYNNTIEGALSVDSGAVAYNNTAASITVSDQGAIAYNNIAETMTVQNGGVAHDNIISSTITVNANSKAYNENVETLIVNGENATAYNNTVKTLTVGGVNAKAYNNTIGTVNTGMGASMSAPIREGLLGVSLRDAVGSSNGDGVLTVNTGAIAYNNIVNGETLIDGEDIQVYDSTLNGDVSISQTSTNVALTENTITGTLTVDGSGNEIADNEITSTDTYAIVLGSSENNRVSGNTLYSSNKEGDGAVQSSSQSNTVGGNYPSNTIYVSKTGSDTNDGETRDTAVASFAKAYEKVPDGGEIIFLNGTYEITSVYTIEKDVNISGEDNVTIRFNIPTGGNYLTVNSNINLTNIKFSSTTSGISCILNYGNITIDYCEFSGFSGFTHVILNRGNLIINNTKFFNNSCKQQVVKNNGKLTIDNNEFYGNVLSDLAGYSVINTFNEVNVKNSLFKNNTVKTGVISLSGSYNSTIVNCTFVDNNHTNANSGIINIQSQANCTIKESAIINNNGKASAFYLSNSKLNITDSVILNSVNDIFKFYTQDTSSVVTANDNWWGNNTKPVTGTVDVDRWIIMSVTPETAVTGSEVTITASFDKTNSTSGVVAEYNGNLPSDVLNVTFTSTSGGLNEVKAVQDGQASVTYTPVRADTLLTVTSSDAVVEIPVEIIRLSVVYVSETGVDTNDGETRQTPVASLAQAYELVSENGRIIVLDDITVSSSLTVAKDLEIVGDEGASIKFVDAYITNEANLNITNITFKDSNSQYIIYSDDEHNVHADKLILDNCHFIDNVVSESVIYCYFSDSLTVNNSEFDNNTCSNGVVYSVTNTLINNSEFINNVNLGSSFGPAIVFIENDMGGGRIENSIFDNNTAQTLIRFNMAGFSVFNCTIDNNNILNSEKGSLIYSQGVGEVKESVIINNKGVGNSFYVTDNGLVVSDSVILNGVGNTFVFTGDFTATANDNWWGSNDQPVISGVSIDRWVIMSVTPETVTSGIEVTITASFDKTNSTGGVIADYTGNLDTDVLNVTFTSASGGLNEVKAVQDGQASVTYTPLRADGKLTVTSTNAVVDITVEMGKITTVYVSPTGSDSNTGETRDTPVQTIKYAVEISDGNIIVLAGEHTVNSNLIVNSNLNIVGEDGAIVKFNVAGKPLTNNAKLNLTNLVFENIYVITPSPYSTELEYMITNAGSLSIDTCEFSGFNGGHAIIENRNYVETNLTINNSKFHDNNLQYVGIKCTGNVNITNSEFYNNKVDSDLFGVITLAKDYSSKIENTSFYKNNAPSILYISGDGTSVVNCSFEDNTITSAGVIDCHDVVDTAIDASVFINNTESCFKLKNSTVNISDSVILKEYSNIFKFDDNLNVVTANDNWWGNNTAPEISDVTIERWVIMSVTPESATAEEEVTLIASFDKTNSTGGVIADYNGDLHTEVLNVTFTSTSGGLNEVKAVQDGQASVTYTPVRADTELTVTSTNAVVEIPVQLIIPDILIDVTEEIWLGQENSVTVTVPQGTGSVTIKVNGRTIATPELSGGSVTQTIEVTDIIEGENTVEVTYDGFTNSTTFNALVVPDIVIDVTKEIWVGDDNSVTVTIAGGVGDITIKLNGNVIATPTLSGGSATVTIDADDIVVGENTIGVTYKGLTNSTTFNAVVIPDIVIDVTKEIWVGDDNSVTVTIADGVGDISIKLNGVEIAAPTLSGGSATVTIDAANIATGENTIEVAYKGLTNSTTFNALVVPDIVIDVTKEIWVGDDNSVTVTIAGGVGDITIKLNGNVIATPTLSGGSATVTIDADDIVVGENTIGVTYKGLTNSTTFNAVVIPDIVIDVTKEIWVGDDNSVTVTIAGGVGDISIKLNGVEIATPALSGGSATVTIDAANIATGENTIEVTYKGLTNSTTFNANVPDIVIDVTKYIWFGSGNSVTVSIPDGVGDISIKLNGVEIAAPTLSGGSATVTIDVANIIAGENTIEVAYKGFTNSTTFTALNNVVTPENFDKFFEDDGYLVYGMPFDELIFKGEFNRPVDEIVIINPLSIVGDGATLHNTKFTIESDDVKLDNLTLVGEGDLGSLIWVNGKNNVTLSNLNISYSAGDKMAVAIDVKGNDVKILNNTIFFESHVKNDTEFAVGLKLDDCRNALVDGNNITAVLPCVYVDNYDENYYMMGSDKVDPVRLKDCDKLVFTNNNINSTTNNCSSGYPTLQAIQIIGCTNSLLDHNNISMIDELTPEGIDNYLYGINFGYNSNVTFSYNNFNMSTKGGLETNGTAYAFQGMASDVTIRGNNITTVSNGPNLGIYVASTDGQTSTLLIEDNFINVTGRASSRHNWGLVSGIEIQNGDTRIYNNTIYTYNKNAYDEYAYMYGISYAQWMYGDRSFDIKDNEIYTEGKYTISIINATSLDAERNTLYAHELAGDDSISPGLCDAVVLIDNIPYKKDVLIVSDDYIWPGVDASVNITVIAPGNVTIKVNGREVAVEQVLVDNTFNYTVSASDLISGENVIEVTYNGAELYLVNTNTTVINVLGNVVTNDTFYYYFDDSGVLRDVVPFDSLVFEGEFSNLVSRITIDRTLTVTGNDAILNDIGFTIADVGVVLDNMTLIANSDLGDLIEIAVGGATVSNMNISYVTSDVGNAIRAYLGADNINILNNTIYFESTYNALDTYDFVNAISIDSGADISDVEYITGVVIDGNDITAVIPSFTTSGYDHEYYLMGLSSVNGVRLNGVKDLEFTNNSLDVTTNALYGSTPTLQALYLASIDNALIKGNNISMIDTFTPTGTASYLYAVQLMYGEDLEISENNFNISTAGGKANAGSAYGISIVDSTVDIINNNITSVSNGPNLGIFLPILGQAPDVVITGNFINVTGLATNTSNHGLVSGIEVQTGYVEIKQNTIYTYNVGEYEEDNYLYGISYAQDGVVSTFEITDNTIYTEGHYTISFIETDNAVVTGNYLVASDLYGDGSVEIRAGDDNTVKNNLPLDPKLTISVENTTVDREAVINVSLNASATGVVNVIVNGKVYPVDIDDEGKGQITVQLPASTYTAGVTFESTDVRFVSSENETVFEVSKLENDISISISDVVIDENVTVNVTAPGATGKVVIIVDGKEHEFELVDGNASCTIENITAGNHSVVVVYLGDDTHDVAINSTSISVDKLQSSISIAPIDVQFVGSTFTISVTNDTAVNVTINGESYDLIGGVVDIDTTKLAAGEYIVVVSALESDRYLANSDSTTFKVVKYSSAIESISVPTADVVVGQNATIVVTMAGEEDGEVVITINGVKYTVAITDKVARLNVTLPINDYSVVATYSGSDKYNASASVDGQFKVIGKEASIITITPPSGDVKVGEIVEIGVSTNGDNLVVKINDEVQNVVDGKITYTVVAAGSYNIVATTTENETVYGNMSSAAFTAVKNDASITIDPIATVEVDNEVTIVVTNVSGPVTIKVNGNAIEGNSFTPDAVGTYVVTVESAENGTYYAGFATATFTVVKHASAIEGISVPSDVVVGGNATIKVTMAGAEDGDVVISINGVKYTVAITDKVAELNVTLPVGDYDVVATYSGSDKYNASASVDGQFKVIGKEASIITITPPSDDVKVGEIVEIGVSTNGDNLIVKINGVEQTVEEGVIKYRVEAAGSYSIVATTTENETVYGNVSSAAFTAVKNDAVLSIAPISAIVGDLVEINVENVTDGALTVMVNGKPVENNMFTISKAGSYTITVESAATDAYNAGFAIYTFDVEEIIPGSIDSKANITVPQSSGIGETPVVSVELPADASGYVTVYVDGKKFDRVAANATVNVPLADLPAGEHTIEVRYSGDDNYAPVSEITTLTVDKSASAVDVTITPGKAGEKSLIKVDVTDGATGTVIIDVNGTRYSIDLATGNELELVLNAGEYSVVATYSGDDRYDSNMSGVQSFTVSDKANANIKVEIPDDIKVGDEITINITADTDAELTVTINGEVQTVIYANGPLSISLDALLRAVENAKVVYTVPGAGIYNITVKVDENDEFASQIVTVIFEATKKDAEITIDEITAEIGDNVTISVHTDSDGALTVKVNGEEVTGEYEITKAGAYTITVESAATDSYNKAFASYTFNVAEPEAPEPDNNVTVVVDGVEYPGEIVNGTVTIKTNATVPDNNVTVIVDGVEYPGEIVNGTVTIKTNATEPDDNVTVIVDGVSYPAKIVNGTVVIDTNATLPDDNVTVIVDGVEYPAKIVNGTVVIDTEPDDNVTVIVDGVEYPAKIVNGTVVIDTNATVPDNNVTVIVDGVEYPGEIVNGTVTIKTNATEPDDNVTVIVDGVSYPAKIVNGTVVIDTNATLPDDNVTVIVDGVEYPAKIVNGTVVIDTEPNDNVTVIVDGVEYPARIVNGTVVIDTNATLPDDNVTVIVDGVSYPAKIVNGTVVIDTEPNDNVTVIVDGVEYPARIVNGTVVIDTNATLPDNNVTVIVDGVSYPARIVNGTVVIDTNATLPDNNVTVIVDGVSYPGEIVNGTVTIKTNATVIPEPVDAGANITAPESAVAGETPVVAVELPEDATGTVSVIVDGKEFASAPVENGTVNIPLEDLPAGEHAVEVKYSGDDKYASASQTSTLTVDRITPVINAEVEPISEGEIAVVNVTVDSDATGVILVDINNNKYYGEIRDGKATVKIPGLTNGTFTATVVYAGDDKYANVSSTVKVTVTAADEPVVPETPVSVKVPENVKPGDDTSVDISIPDATGNVTVIVDGKETTVALKGGSASVPISNVGAGDHSVVVIYPGDETHAPAYASKSFTVPAAQQIETKFSDIIVADGNLTAKLVDANGNAISNANIAYVIDGTEKTLATSSDGTFTIGDVDGKTVTIRFDGKGSYLPTNTSISLEKSETPSVVTPRLGTVLIADDFEQYSCDHTVGERGRNFTGQLVDSNGVPLANKVILIGYNGINFNRTTNATGHFAVQIGLQNAGLYTFAMSFLDDGQYNASFIVKGINIVKKPTSIEAKDATFKAKKKTKKLTVTLKTILGASVDGKIYLKEGKKLTLTVDGKTYKAKTDADGKATFKITGLNTKGKYKAKISFAGDTFVYKKSKAKIKITVK